ncbi:MAG: hypothetical protein FWF92_10135 [Oscillospiraceae bacterium]|nr:hypothetical protein [Oscillospiraceae bacterium]
MLKGWRKYLFAAALAVLAAFCGYFYFAIEHVNDMLMQEKIIDKRFDVDLICDEIDRFVELENNWEVHNYGKILSGVIMQMDSTDGIYAELFDENLESISKYEQQTSVSDDNSFNFNIESYPEFIREVKTNESGEIWVCFDKDGTDAHDFYIYYRWVPTDKNLSGRFLAVIGVSKYSVNTGISSWITYGAVSLIIISAVFIVSTVTLLCRRKY